MTLFMEEVLLWPMTGKFSPSFSQFRILNPTGWTATPPGVTTTRNWEGGLAVWERFE